MPNKPGQPLGEALVSTFSIPVSAHTAVWERLNALHHGAGFRDKGPSSASIASLLWEAGFSARSTPTTGSLEVSRTSGNRVTDTLLDPVFRDLVPGAPALLLAKPPLAQGVAGARRVTANPQILTHDQQSLFQALSECGQASSSVLARFLDRPVLEVDRDLEKLAGIGYAARPDGAKGAQEVGTPDRYAAAGPRPYTALAVMPSEWKPLWGDIFIPSAEVATVDRQVRMFRSSLRPRVALGVMLHDFGFKVATTPRGDVCIVGSSGLPRLDSAVQQITTQVRRAALAKQMHDRSSGGVGGL